MERDVYNSIYRTTLKKIQHEKATLVASIPIFQPLSAELQSVLCDALHYEECPENHIIFCKGDEGNTLYLIKEGAVEISSGDKVSRRWPCCLDATLRRHASLDSVSDTLLG